MIQSAANISMRVIPQIRCKTVWICFWIFLFGKLTERHCFVTYLWNSTRILYSKQHHNSLF